MLQQIQQAVDIANSSTADAESKKRALEYVEQMKSDANASQMFALYLQESSTSDVGRFVALQVLTDLTTEGAHEERLIYLKDTALMILGHKVGKVSVEPEYVRNKVAEWVSQLFYSMYGEINGNLWSNFFPDLMEATNITRLKNGATGEYSIVGLDYFLRICASINSEIGDQTFVRSKEAQKKNNSLKDSMRMKDIGDLTCLWKHGLQSIQKDLQQQGLAILIMQCIGSYISWIDINLIVNSEYISIIYEYLNFSKAKVSCAQCLSEIISKKMKPGHKLQLLDMLNLADKVSEAGDADIEVHEKLCKLLTIMGVELSSILEQCHEDAPSEESRSIAMAADQQIIRNVAPLILKFMSYKDNSVTQQTFPFFSHYLTFLKKPFALGGKPGSVVAINSKKLPLDQDHHDFLISLLSVCMKKMAIDHSIGIDDTDEIEEFVETVRSRLKVFQDAIAVINPSIYLDNISKFIESLLMSEDWRNLELALYLIYNLAESIRNNHFGFNKFQIAQSRPVQLMTKFMDTILNNSLIFQSTNPLIEISFFELIVRHYNFINNTEKNEISIFDLFCTPFGMFNPRERVRLRTWYLFSRLIKVTKPKLEDDTLTQILLKISPLLILKTIQGLSSDTDLDIIFDNQLYIFEGVGMLIGAKVTENYDILDSVLNPLFSTLESCISASVRTPEVVLQAHHILMAIGTIGRGVHVGLVPENQIKNIQITSASVHTSLIEKFSNIAEVILVTFSYFNKYEIIRDATRFSFARLTPILKNNIILFSSRLISIFLESDLKTIEMNDFLGFLVQMVHNFHKDENCYQLFNNLLTPLIKKVFTLLERVESEGILAASSSPTSAFNELDACKNVVITDSFRDKKQLKKAYYGFLQSFVTNNITSLLLTSTNRNILPLILNDLLTYKPEEIHESSYIKLSLNLLVNFVKFFGTGICSDLNDHNANNFEPIEGLNEFFITKAVSLVFEIPFKPEYGFSIDDCSCRVIANDLSRLLKALCDINGDFNNNSCLKYLTEVYFLSIQVPQQITLEFVHSLATLNEKQFEKYFVNFIRCMNPQ